MDPIRFPDFAPGTVWLVGAGPGDPGLLTLHARHALELADVVLHDALVEPAILALCGPHARVEPVGKRAGKGGAKQLRIQDRLVQLARQGLRVVRLKGGDPLVFGRGGEEMRALAAAGVPFRVVPGVTAGVGALAYAGIPTTHRGIGQAVAFATGHGAAGHAPEVDWAGLARSAPTLVIFMGLNRLDALAAEFLTAGRTADEPVALIADATTPRQQVVRTTLAAAPSAARALPSEAAVLIAIGPVVGLADGWSGLQATTPATIATPAAPLAATGSSS
jgi:uroporphyrin-III C-methyltransferase